MALNRNGHQNGSQMAPDDKNWGPACPSGLQINLWGSTWVMDGAQSGFWTGLNLEYGWGPILIMDGAQSVLLTGLNLDCGQGSIWIMDSSIWMRYGSHS